MIKAKSNNNQYIVGREPTPTTVIFFSLVTYNFWENTLTLISYPHSKLLAIVLCLFMCECGGWCRVREQLVEVRSLYISRDQTQVNRLATSIFTCWVISLVWLAIIFTFIGTGCCSVFSEPLLGVICALSNHKMNENFPALFLQPVCIDFPTSPC